MSDIPQKTIADPKTHYGSGRAAVRGFILERLTGALNVLFTIFFAWFIIRVAGHDRATMVERLHNPIVALLLAAMIVNVAVHMRIGMREVIEDYVHDERLNRLSLWLNTLFCALIVVASLAALAKIVFWG